MRLAPKEVPSDAGFQIAPMIDVVFVIMLFFMVMAGAVKVEHELKTTLPGNAETAKETDMPDEVTIGVSESGQITINEDPVGQPQDRELEGLFNEMTKMAQAAKQSKTKLLITVQAEEAARYERVINVLDILAKADISNITFSVAEPE
ncbi:MAG: biopolymer transporter ExbD [Opitutales bacterium]|jgi:biopolymer transport protein ExbD|nr:biopolymer transporter ExbD [Opitutales bacterium]